MGIPRSQWLGGTGALRGSVYREFKTWSVISSCSTAVTPTSLPAFPTTSAQPSSRGAESLYSIYYYIYGIKRREVVWWHRPNFNYYLRSLFFIFINIKIKEMKAPTRHRPIINITSRNEKKYKY